jgi:RepB DNA-primase from phage plasmid
MKPLEFLKWLRPDGPWVLTAIHPDNGSVKTNTCANAADVREFLHEHGSRANIYYSVNPCRRTMTRKARKQDIATAEFVHADLDPRDDETPAQAKARYRRQLDSCEPAPTAIIDSGNGLQVLWRLKSPSQNFSDVEARSRALTLKLGGKAGTQNVDRILRLPGTINRPQKRKRDLGRVRCEASVIEANGGSDSAAPS